MLHRLQYTTVKSGFGNAAKKSLKLAMAGYCNPSDLLGRGAGKGGGAGGSVRESGGGLGAYGAAQEEMFFHNKQKEQIEELKKKLKNEGKAIEQKKEDK
ncbi:unnamed protein product [Leptosia nina]|uniref:Uncharacterized protein n=1 Tax=Leptosia nina TaxID=320188 RepID=A0AAV1J1T5_9NEOP